MGYICSKGRNAHESTCQGQHALVARLAFFEHNVSKYVLQFVRRDHGR